MVMFYHNTRISLISSVDGRPCERSLGNAMQFKKIIVETQRSLEQDSRTKRCVGISLSVVKPPRKVRSSGDLSWRRKSLDFNEADTQPVLGIVATTSVALEVSSVLNSCAIWSYVAENMTRNLRIM